MGTKNGIGACYLDSWVHVIILEYNRQHGIDIQWQVLSSFPFICFSLNCGCIYIYMYSTCVLGYIFSLMVSSSGTYIYI